MLISQNGIPPRKKVVRRIPGRRQEGREKRRNLRTGQETGSGGRRTVAEGPKGQGTKLRKRYPISTEPTWGTKWTDTKDTRVRTRYKGGRAHGTGQNYRTNPTKLLEAQNERKNHRLRQKLPRVPAEQGGPTPTLWPDLPAGTTIHPVAIHSDGLHHGLPPLGQMRPAMGSGRPIHQDGTLPSPKKGRKGGGRPSGHLCQRSMEAPWPPCRYSVGPRLQIHLGDLEGVPTAFGNPASHVHSVPPADRLTDRTAQPDN